MMLADNIAHAAVSMAEAQAYARVETGEEEALLAGLTRTASALCEGFTGMVLIARAFPGNAAEFPLADRGRIGSSRRTKVPVAVRQQQSA
jgi:uncharacterized phiE125 gp8 family phage protein